MPVCVDILIVVAEVGLLFWTDQNVCCEGYGSDFSIAYLGRDFVEKKFFQTVTKINAKQM